MVRKALYCPPTDVDPAYVAACKALNSHFHLDGSCRAVISGHLQNNGVQIMVPGLRSISGHTHGHVTRIFDRNRIDKWNWWMEDDGLRIHLFKSSSSWLVELTIMTIPILFAWYFDVHKIYTERFG